MRTQVLHFNCGKLKLSVKDLLNQNTGINRNANQNYIEDSRVNSLRRFFFAQLYLQFYQNRIDLFKQWRNANDKIIVHTLSFK